MRCPTCDGDTQVVDSRISNRVRGCVRRRRDCKECGERFTTVEVVQDDWINREDLLKRLSQAAQLIAAMQFPVFKPRRRLKSEK